MEQYTFEDLYKGKPRKLLILMPQDGQHYRVFCEANFMGVITAERNAADVVIWRSDYNILKPIVSKIGAHIESFDKADLM